MMDKNIKITMKITQEIGAHPKAEANPKRIFS